MSEPLVRIQQEDGIARLVLNNPGAGNALDWALTDAFAAAAQSIDPAATRAVLFTAEGRNFCVGGDIRAFHASEDREAFLRGIARRLNEGVLALAALPAPVIVAVQGAAAGAGFSFALGGDLVLAGRSAHFTMAYSGIGFTADGGASWLLPRLVGLRRAQELALTNRRLSAPEAAEWGIVTRVVPDEELADQAEALAQTIAAGPTRAYGEIKRLLATSFTSGFEAQLGDEAETIARVGAGPDGREGLAAFIERRQPSFKGQ